MRTLTLTLSLLAACNGDYTQDDLLESPRVSGPESLSGEATVEATDAESGDYTLTFAEDQQLTLHSPGRLDLSGLDGRELTAAAEQDFGVNVTITDADGVVYAARSHDYVDGLPDGTFSAGDELGSEKRDGYRYTYVALKVATDGGAVELLPGESAFLEIEGQTWQVVHHGSYEADGGLFDSSKCGPSGAMSYEVLRVDAAGEDEVLSRPEGEDPVRDAGCG